MSHSSERKRIKEGLMGYCLMSVPESASVLSVEPEVVHGMIGDGVLPTITVGRREYVDPIDLIVYILAEKEGVSMSEYERLHGSAVGDLARAHYAKVQKMRTAA